jgi:hypothetical protein
MSIVTSYHLESQISSLQSSLDRLTSISNLIAFQFEIDSLIQTLRGLGSVVHQKANKFGRLCPQSLLLSIFSFLYGLQGRQSRCVCKLWHSGLTLPSAQMVLPYMYVMHFGLFSTLSLHLGAVTHFFVLSFI